MTDKIETETKKGCLWWVLRVGGGVIGVLILLTVISLINQRIALPRELAALPAPGELIEANGHLMHLYCTGEGSPTVVIDAGNADFSLSWRNVQDGLAQDTRVCTYDRAGYGWSESTDAPRDAAHVVEELHTLLQAEDSGPYLLVGHSLGGIHMQLYALTYPEEVAALVLVDNPPAYTDFIDSPEYQASLQTSAGIYTGTRIALNSGMQRLLGPAFAEQMQPETARAIPEIADTYMTLVQQPEHWQAALDEVGMIEQSAEQVRAAYVGEQPFGDLPLIVLEAGVQPPEIAGLTRDGHTRQTQLSTQGELRVIENSSHLMHLDAPEAIIQAVRDLLG